MIDSNLNDARSFLVSLIEEGLVEGGNKKRATELAFKILLLLGIVRSNVEDLLMAATLMDRLKDEQTVDLRIELEILLKENMQA
jgi:arginine repressor